MTSLRSAPDRPTRCRALLGAAALAVTLAGAAFAPAPARAQGSAEDLKDRAEAHFNKGRELVDLGEFERAAAEYRKAYELVPHPEILYHLGQAHRLKGDRRTALDYYRKYLVIEPRGRAAAKTRRYIELLERAISEEEARAAQEKPGDRAASAAARREGDRPSPPTAAPEPGQTQTEAGAEAIERAHGSDDLFTPTFTADPIRDQPAPGRALRIAGLSAAGLGAVGLILGVKLGLDARSLSQDLSRTDRAAWTDEDIDDFSRGKRLERGAVLAAFSGALLAGGGVALYLVGQRRADLDGAGDAPDLAITPQISPTAVGVGVSGRF